MNNYLLKIPNISCNHCVMRIKKALEEIGEKEFEISLENVKEKLSEIDYHAKEVKKI